MNGKEKNFFRGKKILITGAGGFIGSHLANYLYRKDAELYLFIRYTSKRDIGNLRFFNDELINNSHIIFGNLREKNTVENIVKKVDIIFHLAATISVPYSFINPDGVILNNILSTLNILTSSIESNVEKIIVLSSSEVYGTAKYAPIDEKHPISPQSPYAASKASSDSITKSFYHTYNLPVLIVRPFNTYGPGQSLRAVIPSIIFQALKFKKIKIGRLESKRDFNYIDDTINGLILSAEKGNFYGETINISSGKEFSIKEIIDNVSEILGEKFEIEVEKERVRSEKAEVFRLLGDFSKAEKLINYQPKISLKEGLKKTIKFIKKNLNYYEKEFKNRFYV